jgi:hypothetical protein
MLLQKKGDEIFKLDFWLHTNSKKTQYIKMTGRKIGKFQKSKKLWQSQDFSCKNKKFDFFLWRYAHVPQNV